MKYILFLSFSIISLIIGIIAIIISIKDLYKPNYDEEYDPCVLGILGAVSFALGLFCTTVYFYNFYI